MPRNRDPLRTPWLEVITAPIWLPLMLMWALLVYALYYALNTLWWSAKLSQLDDRYVSGNVSDSAPVCTKEKARVSQALLRARSPKRSTRFP